MTKKYIVTLIASLFTAIYAQAGADRDIQIQIHDPMPTQNPYRNTPLLLPKQEMSDRQALNKAEQALTNAQKNLAQILQDAPYIYPPSKRKAIVAGAQNAVTQAQANYDRAKAASN